MVLSFFLLLRLPEGRGGKRPLSVHQVGWLQLRDGLIIDLQDYASGGKAVRALRGWRLKL